MEEIFCRECGAYKPTKDAPLTWLARGGASAATWKNRPAHAAGAMAEQSTGDATITIEGKPVRVETYAELNELASRMATAAKVAGCRGVVIALSIEKGGHSYFDVRVMGPCLEIEGLASHIPEVLAKLWPKAPAGQ